MRPPACRPSPPRPCSPGASPDRGRLCADESSWKKFPDGTDQIRVGGFPAGKWANNKIYGGHVLFLASFHNNDVALSQFYALHMLAESFPASVTVLLPFFPTATMERIVSEGEVATANTLSKMFNHLPSVGAPPALPCPRGPSSPLPCAQRATPHLRSWRALRVRAVEAEA